MRGSSAGFAVARCGALRDVAAGTLLARHVRRLFGCLAAASRVFPAARVLAAAGGLFDALVGAAGLVLAGGRRLVAPGGRGRALVIGLVEAAALEQDAGAGADEALETVLAALRAALQERLAEGLEVLEAVAAGGARVV